jgi:hypothetical protein
MVRRGGLQVEVRVDFEQRLRTAVMKVVRYVGFT